MMDMHPFYYRVVSLSRIFLELSFAGVPQAFPAFLTALFPPIKCLWRKKTRPAFAGLTRCSVPPLEGRTKLYQSRVRKPVEAVAGGRIDDDVFDGAVVGDALGRRN